MDSRLACVALVTVLMMVGAVQAQVVDPFEVIAAFDHAAEAGLWPDFDATAYPIAVYDGDRTLLLRHPSPPEEFVPLGPSGSSFVSPTGTSPWKWSASTRWRWRCSIEARPSKVTF
jgi:hypothetical protein